MGLTPFQERLVFGLPEKPNGIPNLFHWRTHNPIRQERSGLLAGSQMLGKNTGFLLSLEKMWQNLDLHASYWTTIR